MMMARRLLGVRTVVVFMVVAVVIAVFIRMIDEIWGDSGIWVCSLRSAVSQVHSGNDSALGVGVGYDQIRIVVVEGSKIKIRG